MSPTFMSALLYSKEYTKNILGEIPNVQIFFKNVRVKSLMIRDGVTSFFTSTVYVNVTYFQ